MLRCLVSSIEIYSSYPLCYTYQSSGVAYLFVLLALIVSRETPAPFCLGWRKWRLLDCSLAFSVMRRVWIFLYSWGFPCLDDSLGISSR